MPDGCIATNEQLRDDSVAWATSFARDQRACHIQNHDHDCTGTCVKYQRKKQGSATELPVKVNKKIKGAGVPKCRFRFFRVIELWIDSVLVSFTRRGKELVKKPYISSGNDENEYGKAMVQRDGPFRSSSQDVLQVNLRCNADSVSYTHLTLPTKRIV